MFSCEFSEICSCNLFAGHMEMATSECSLFHDFSEKKHYTINQKETRIHP